MYMLPPMILWNIWKSRNNHRFNNSPMSVTAILKHIKVDICILYKATHKVLPTNSTAPEMLSWLDISHSLRRHPCLLLCDGLLFY